MLTAAGTGYYRVPAMTQINITRQSASVLPVSKENDGRRVVTYVVVVAHPGARTSNIYLAETALAAAVEVAERSTFVATYYKADPEDKKPYVNIVCIEASENGYLSRTTIGPEELAARVAAEAEAVKNDPCLSS